ncbi:MAG: biotin-dependent carboxyltransferase family protein [Albidovulum sp.]|nr:biotin-dependent carboxyltransferase family protein [Albidovulum sp.]
MTVLKVIECGPGTTLQDRGRFGFRRFGVALSGAADGASAALANALAGNPSSEACVEFQLAGGRFSVERGDAIVALAGPDCLLSIGGRTVPPGRSATALNGDVIAAGPVRGGVFAYLAIGGGFDLPDAMGSRSVHVRSGIGGRALAPGDLLAAKAPRLGKTQEIGELKTSDGPICFVAGPQYDHFEDEAKSLLATSRFTVRSDSDRMACRLSGPALPRARNANFVSDGVLPGSIQVPGDGAPMVLLRDCPTTGGYPKIGTVISSDLDRLAQIAPGGTVRFFEVTLNEAIASAHRSNDRLRRAYASIRQLPSTPTTASLLIANLIDGATAGS